MSVRVSPCPSMITSMADRRGGEGEVAKARRRTPANINQYESIRQEESRADDLALPGAPVVPFLVPGRPDGSANYQHSGALSSERDFASCLITSGLPPPPPLFLPFLLHSPSLASFLDFPLPSAPRNVFSSESPHGGYNPTGNKTRGGSPRTRKTFFPRDFSSLSSRKDIFARQIDEWLHDEWVGSFLPNGVPSKPTQRLAITQSRPLLKTLGLDSHKYLSACNVSRKERARATQSAMAGMHFPVL